MQMTPLHTTTDRDRFQILMRMLHFADNSFPSTSGLAKIVSFMDEHIDNFQTVYTPGSELVVDESTVPFRGSVNFVNIFLGKVTYMDVRSSSFACS